MMTLSDVLKDARNRHIAIGHFNVSDVAEAMKRKLYMRS
jgi:hypothetical protein